MVPQPPKAKKAPIQGSTQDFTEIRDVVDDVLILRNNSAVCLVEVGAVNFYLLSSEEQTSSIYGYANLLNSLSFPVQVVIMSKKMDISNYIDYINTKVSEQGDPIVKNRLESYKEFIKTVVKKNTVLEKRFFFTIPFNALEMGVSASNNKNLSVDYIASRAKTSLYPKRDHLIRLLSKIGLRGNIAQSQDIVEMFYNLYNPSATGRQLAPVATYTTPLMSQN